MKKKTLKKMGYKKGEQINMDIKDLLKLGEMGYTKAEIEEIRKNEAEKEAAAPVAEQIKNLEEQLKELKGCFENSAIHETVTDAEPSKNVVDEGLKILAGVSDGKE